MHRLRAIFAGIVRSMPRALVALVLSGLPGASLAAQTWQSQVDYTKLQQRLGSSLPTGAGGVISQVEAGLGSSAAYYVDASSPEFDGSQDPTNTPVTFTDGSFMASKGVSGHATNTVGARMYGDTESLAPGANNVVLYEANHWLSNIVRYSSSMPPDAQNYRVQNHSWVGTLATGDPPPQPFVEHPNNVKVLQRFDYMVETANGGQGMTAVVGLNNSTNPIPYLLSHSYNAIGVGKTDGFHSSGLTLSPPTASYGPGRSKPDIVAPLSSTSAATAAVSSAATLLYDAVEGTADASNNEVIKSMLLAGATKNEFPTWSRTAAQPLDDTYGAGELNIYNSYLIQLGGRHAGTTNAPTSAAPSYGWDYQDHKSSPSTGDIFYNFEVPAGSTAQELSVALSWNAEVTDADAGTGFAPSHSLQNLDLRFYDSNGTFMGSLLDQSTSAVDNVEHLYFTDLAAGTYTLKVSNAAGWDYGLAWRTKTQFNLFSGDFNGDGAVDGADFLTWQRNLGTLLGATASEGDADGDGDVDAEDLGVWRAGIIAAPPAAVAGLVGVPEPATGLLAAAGLGALFLGARRVRGGNRRDSFRR
ncbi:MAG TPA: dockerin type I domain-containing protein [Lacipirellula sp.]